MVKCKVVRAVEFFHWDRVAFHRHRHQGLVQLPISVPLDQPAQEILIVRPVQVLRGYRNIAAALRTSEEKVRDMIGYGAPVVLDGDMPKAEAAELWTWYARWMGEGGARGSC